MSVLTLIVTGEEGGEGSMAAALFLDVRLVKGSKLKNLIRSDSLTF